jgi:hypothetical protein
MHVLLFTRARKRGRERERRERKKEVRNNIVSKTEIDI